MLVLWFCAAEIFLNKINTRRPDSLVSYTTDDIYKNIEEQHPNKGRKLLIVIDDMIAGTLSNEYLLP